MFVLPDLPYKYNALEPYFDEQTMIIHHTKHHQAYVDKLNSALSEYPDLQDKGIEELLKAIDTLPEPLREVVKNHGGGHYNHSHFWNSLKAGGSTPDKQVEMLINKSYGNFENFKQVFTDAALSLFGSGWVWLELDSDKKVSVKKYILQENPLMEGKLPLIGLDVWEHAYYLKYQNKRADYINAWWNIINWEFVSDSLSRAKI